MPKNGPLRKTLLIRVENTCFSTVYSFLLYHCRETTIANHILCEACRIEPDIHIDGSGQHGIINVRT